MVKAGVSYSRPGQRFRVFSTLFFFSGRQPSARSMKGHFVPSKKTASYIGALCLTVLSIGLLASPNSSNVGWPMRAYVSAPARVDRKCVQRFRHGKLAQRFDKDAAQLVWCSCRIFAHLPTQNCWPFCMRYGSFVPSVYTPLSPTRATALHMLFRFVLLCLPLHSLLPPTLKHRNGSFTELDISGILVTTNTLEVICRRCQRLEKLRMGEK